MTKPEPKAGVLDIARITYELLTALNDGVARPPAVVRAVVARLNVDLTRASITMEGFHTCAELRVIVEVCPLGGGHWATDCVSTEDCRAAGESLLRRLATQGGNK